VIDCNNAWWKPDIMEERYFNLFYINKVWWVLLLSRDKLYYDKLKATKHDDYELLGSETV